MFSQIIVLLGTGWCLNLKQKQLESRGKRLYVKKKNFYLLTLLTLAYNLLTELMHSLS